MEDSEILTEIIENGWLIPKWMKNSYEKSLKEGTSLFNQKDLLGFLNQDLEKLFTYDLWSEEFNLKEEQIEKIRKLSSLGESLLFTSLRVSYGWGMPTEETISTIAKDFNKSSSNCLIEVGGGSGLWS